MSKELSCDLKAMPCPINFVRAKIYLDKLDNGVRVRFFVGSQESFENVRKSLLEEGHKLISESKKDFELVFEKSTN